MTTPLNTIKEGINPSIFMENLHGKSVYHTQILIRTVSGRIILVIPHFEENR